MSIAVASSNRLLSRPYSVVVLAGAVAGTLDLVYASTFWGIQVGFTPLQILQSIASGWLGHDAAFAGGYPTALLGLVSHYAIAITMATAFYLASKRWPTLARRPFLYGALYGALLYAVMTYVVVPLSNAGTGHHLPAWRWENLSHIAGHMVLVGIPCALGARRAMALRVNR
jgi:uncharacterized membrane protein YagU involved in acid resistance